MLDIAPWTSARDFLPMSSFGKRVIEAREAKGMTQTELADALGVRPHVMWRYESDSSQPKPERLEKLAKLLGVSTSWLLFGGGDDDVDDRPDPPGLQEFLSLTSDVTDEELVQLRAARFKNTPTVKTYTFLLMAIRETR